MIHLHCSIESDKKSWICSQGRAYFEECSGLLLTYVLHYSLYLLEIQIVVILVGQILVCEDSSPKVLLPLFDGDRLF